MKDGYYWACYKHEDSEGPVQIVKIENNEVYTFHCGLSLPLPVEHYTIVSDSLEYDEFF